MTPRSIVEVGLDSDRSDQTPDDPPPGIDQRLITALLAVTALLVLSAGLWASTHMHVDAILHTTALFVHLSCLVVGFGAVLVVDYHAVLYLVRRCSLSEVSSSAQRLHMLVWAGLAGLVLSGFLLKPDLTSSMTIVKLALVLILTINGLQLRVLNKRMSTADTGALSRLELAWGAASAGVSQLCWWGATFIGFWNEQH